MLVEALIDMAAAIRADRAANPAVAGDGTALELLVAPRLQALIERVLPAITVAPCQVLPEYRLGGVGRPDLAFAGPAQPARSFIELKEPNKLIEPGQLHGHDADQFRRFCELPLWAMTNLVTIKLYRRGELIDQADVVPLVALDPVTSAHRARELIEGGHHDGLRRILGLLAIEPQPSPRNPEEVAQVLAHAARLVREVVTALCSGGLEPVMDNVRAEFNETLFARAEAGGYEVDDADALFASAFSQTLIFGLLLAKEAGEGAEVGENAYQLLPDATYPLLRGTLRALTLDEVRDGLGVAFGIACDAVNSVDTDLLAPRDARDPMLYLYEDFLRVFDQKAVAKYGVYYTRPEVVEFMVAETDRAIRQGLDADGLLDPAVNLLDPACGTGTFLLGAANAVADQALRRYGPAMVGPELTAFGARMHGFELLVGPYTIAHYRMLRQILGRGGTAERLPIFLTDTLAPPAGAAGVAPHLAFMGAPMVAERAAADQVKRQTPILAIIGNPPYKRLKKGEVERLVGADMNRRWEDLKRPVQQAGLGRSLNAFPDLCIAFYRWALWRLFEADGAEGRGVLCFITNRNFLTGTGFGGLRRMLRQRFDEIEIIDLRGEQGGVRPATVDEDKGVFNIKVGVCILIARARGEPREGEAVVRYADIWRAEGFTKADKLRVLREAAADRSVLQFVDVPGSDMARFKPRGFLNVDWPDIGELFTFRSNGIVTYRDKFAYSTTEAGISNRIQNWLQLPAAQAARAFKETRDRKAGPARATVFNDEAIRRVSYRPLDVRYVYNQREFIDFPKPDLQTAWGHSNFALLVKDNGTGAGPAAWAPGLLPDQHAFRGSYGGWVFPFRSHAGEGEGHYLRPGLVQALAAAQGAPVTAEQTFDAILCLLSAQSYAFRFANDLEDDFPAVPFPSNAEVFQQAAILGARIRALETLEAPAAEMFRTARLEGTIGDGAVLAVGGPTTGYIQGDVTGAIPITEDGTVRIMNVSPRAWEFSVSGYPVIQRWLKARADERLTGTSGSALLRSALDTIARVEELVSLFDEADAILAAAIDSALTRVELGLPERDIAALQDNDEADDEDA